MTEKPLRPLHLVSTITNEASGPSYTVVALCKALRDAGDDPSIVVLDTAVRAPMPDFVTSFPSVGFPQRLGCSPAMRRWLRRTVTTGGVDVVHSHGLWMMPNVYSGWAIQGTTTPLIVSPEGTLSPWALNRSKWAKRIFWTVLQAPAIRRACCFHATAEHEYRDIREAGFRQPVCIIPNGIDVPRETSRLNRIGRVRRLLFLGRIHPVKGVDILLKAWGIVGPQKTDWELHIVGPDNLGFLRKMQDLARTLRLQRVVFRGPLYGNEKFRAYQEADIYVLPTHSENFGMTVAEALAAGTPVIVTKGAPWSGLDTNGAGWWIDVGVDPLVACLERALTYSPERLAAMGTAGRRWMRDEYSWERIAKMMLATYRWLITGGQRPEWVRI